MVVWMGWGIAQQFEGVVEVSQQTAEGITYQMKWYIKGDKISYEISSYGGESLSPLRFVPLPDHDKMLMITGTSRTEVASRDIAASGLNLDGVSIREEGNKIIVTTNTTSTEIEVNKTVDMAWGRYTKFFKSDYGIYALAKLDQRGFPVNSVTKDIKTGKILTQTTLKRIQPMKLDDSFFR